MTMERFRLWTAIAEPAERDWLGGLPDDVVQLVGKYLPPGPIGRGDFRSLCQRTRRLANSTTVKAQVWGWSQAARLGTTFPQLEHLEVVVVSPNDMPGLMAFLVHSVPQLTRLVSLEILQGQGIPVGVVQLLCGCMPQLRRLKLPRVQWNGPPSMVDIISSILQLDQLSSLALQVCDGISLASLLSSVAPLPRPDNFAGSAIFCRLHDTVSVGPSGTSPETPP